MRKIPGTRAGREKARGSGGAGGERKPGAEMAPLSGSGAAEGLGWPQAPPGTRGQRGGLGPPPLSANTPRTNR
jgi:hypothetical protein